MDPRPDLCLLFCINPSSKKVSYSFAMLVLVTSTQHTCLAWLQLSSAAASFALLVSSTKEKNSHNDMKTMSNKDNTEYVIVHTCKQVSMR